jgi:hypothetical protein
MMTWKGFERSGRGIIEVLFRNISGGAEENHENISQDSSFLGQDWNRAPPG